MKYSLRSGVIILPLLVAAACGWWTHARRNNQSAAMETYRRAIMTGTEASPTSLLSAFGRTQCKEIMNRNVSLSQDIVFDGNDRWLQILRVPHAHGYGLGDGYRLFSLKNGLTSVGWTLPKGTVISKAYFDGEYVVFRVHGSIDGLSYACEIPQNSPAEYHFYWRQETAVPFIDVAAMIARDYCTPENQKSFP